MSGRWWRAYGRARHEPKLLKLSDKDFRWWFNLVCVAGDHDGTLPPCDDLAVEFRVSPAAMNKAIEALLSAGLFDRDETGIHPHNWDALQYVSDRSSNRVKQFRERRRNVSETPSESESESETETEKKKQPNGCLPAEGGKPKRKSRLSEDWSPTAEQLDYARAQGCSDPSDTATRFKLHHLAKGSLGLDWDRAFQYWCRNEKNFQRQPRYPDRREAAANTVASTDELLWEARFRNYQPGGMWQEATWGPRPESGRCHAPQPVVERWRGRVAQ